MNSISKINGSASAEPKASSFSRRSFFGRAASAGAALAAAGVISRTTPRAAAAAAAPTSGDIAILQFLAAAELLECDLWQQYSELASGNVKFRAALQRIDPALPDYVDGDFYDECSHAELINAYLVSINEEPVSLDPFRTLPSVQVEGALNIGRLTNLTALKIDTSFYNRYRTSQNPDFGDMPAQEVILGTNQGSPGVPAVPTSDKLTANELQGIAQTAAFHFAVIEQGGSSLYNALISNVTNLTVLNILASIGSTEVYHFAAFQTSLEGIVKLKTKSGLSFPAINRDPTRGKVTPHPCTFLSAADPLCSVIRPRSIANAGAVATVTALAAQQLFAGQSQAFVNAATNLAQAADAAVRNG